jgi:[ribosomal protein S18]-alanine N-acetyltransferase
VTAFNIRWYEHGRDLESFAAIDVKSHEEYWSLEDFKKRLRQKAISCLVAEEAGQTIGFLLYELFLHRFSILRIGVLPSCRRKKVGTRLISALVEKLTEKRTLISVEVRETNLPTQLFLKAQGFLAVEVLRQYYQDTEEDGFVFHYRTAREVGDA